MKDIVYFSGFLVFLEIFRSQNDSKRTFYLERNFFILKMIFQACDMAARNWPQFFSVFIMIFQTLLSLATEEIFLPS